MESIAEVVRARRHDLGITQQLTADLAGVSRKAVSEIERGKATVRVDVLSKVLAALGLRLDAS
jgi:y4mF family transcriptional regulator